jgi:hypothetical protein
VWLSGDGSIESGLDSPNDRVLPDPPGDGDGRTYVDLNPVNSDGELGASAWADGPADP